MRPAHICTWTPTPTWSFLTSRYTCTIPLRWSRIRAYYSDGSAATVGQQTLTGGSFYQTHQPHDTPLRIHTVNPGGKRETNTITRAELAAITATLMHASQQATIPPHLTIFTDSLACIHLINRALREPHTLLECKHAPMLFFLRGLLMTRSRTGYSTHLQKVISHSGIIGNELADIGALRARHSPDSTDFNLSDIDNQYLASLPAWPCFSSPTLSADLSRPVNYCHWAN